MRVSVVTPPFPIVTWEEADDHLKLDRDSDQRAYVDGLVAAATAHIDGPEGWLGRAIGEQVLEARFSLSVCDTVRLPCPPVIDLVSVKYLDAGGVEQTAAIDAFELYGAELAPVASWPWLGGSTRREAGRVRYRAGYALPPAPIKAAILLMVGDLHRFRSTATDMSVAPRAIPMSTTVESLLAPYRVFG